MWLQLINAHYAVCGFWMGLIVNSKQIIIESPHSTYFSDIIKFLPIHVLIAVSICCTYSESKRMDF